MKAMNARGFRRKPAVGRDRRRIDGDELQLGGQKAGEREPGQTDRLRASGLDLVRKALGKHEIATVQTTAIDEAGLIRHRRYPCARTPGIERFSIK
jgi:hypothetical protein